MLKSPVNDTSDDAAMKRRGWPKGKKRKKSSKDDNAPKKPLSGYVRFMNKRRDEILRHNPTLTFAEITKLLGEEWSSLSPSEKRIYLDIAEKEKQKYWREVEEYQRSDAYKVFIKKGKEDVPSSSNEKSNISSAVPIFTTEFLEHNKSKETELHQLNKTNTELEQQNAILATHVNSLRGAIVKLDAENKSLSDKNQSLQENLSNLRELLVAEFSSTPLHSLDAPDMDNIDDYLGDVCDFLQQSLYNDNETASSIHHIMTNIDAKLETLYKVASK
uniref:HMG box domain-containing protein n=1 Tax=Ciona savignyi TaxID=51511 RepID=H2Y957_CIOSA